MNFGSLYKNWTELHAVYPASISDDKVIAHLLQTNNSIIESVYLKYISLDDAAKNEFNNKFSRIIKTTNDFVDRLNNKKDPSDVLLKIYENLTFFSRNIRHYGNDEYNISIEKITDKELTNTIAEIEGIRSRVEELRKTATSDSTLINKQKEKINNLLSKIESTDDKARRSLLAAEAISKEFQIFSEAKDKLSQTETKANQIIELAENSRIKAKETSDSVENALRTAGILVLAKGFAAYKKKHLITKCTWGVIFALSMLGIITITTQYIIPKVELSHTSEIWPSLTLRITIIAPIVWLGWFSAIQYNNTVRLEEDYAFKCATISFYESFKNQIGEIDKQCSIDTITVKKIITSCLITVLTDNPLSKLGKSKDEASPSCDILNFFCKKPHD